MNTPLEYSQLAVGYNHLLDKATALAEENARLRRWLVMPVRARLIEYLLSLAVEVESEMVVKGHPSQQAMADAIWTSRESASREITQLKREGLLVEHGKGLGRRRMSLSPRLRDEHERGREAALRRGAP